MISHGKSPFSSYRLRASAHRLRRHAAHWLIRLTSGEATPADFADFRRWRDLDPENRAALHAIRDAWIALGSRACVEPPIVTVPPLETGLPVPGFVSTRLRQPMVLPHA